MSKETRSKMISIKLTPTEFKALRAICEVRGCTMTSLLVGVLGETPKDAQAAPRFIRR